MKFTLPWLKEHLDTVAPLDEIVDKLTMIGLEVERVEDKAKECSRPSRSVSVISAVQHPNADRLRVCMVDTGDGKPIQIVCGAPNARTGMKAVLGLPGTYIPGKKMTLSVGKIRDVESHGMLISGAEIGFSDDSDGIIEMPADAPVGKPFAEVLGLSDPVIEINLTPNRPDCTGVNGIARDLGATAIGDFKDRPPKPVKGTFPCPVKVTLDFGATHSLCPAFGLRLIKGVKNGPSPDWLQKRLTAIGLRPINALVDITNFITIDRGRPLHVFDAAKVHGNLTVRRANNGETLLALDGKTYTLDQAICVIADEEGVESLAGIMGGEATGCSETTTDVLIELALWDELNIAQTGRKLGINSDARYRFERGVDPNFMLPGLELATQMVLDLCGGTPSEIVVAGDPSPKETVIDFPQSELQRLAGIKLSLPEMRRVLEKLGFFAAGQSERVKIAVPSWRPDVHGKADIVEELVRIVGVDRVPSTPFPARRACAQARAHADPEPHPQGQARARRPRPARGCHLVVRLQARGGIVRRRQCRFGVGQSDRGRAVRHAAEPAARFDHGGAAQCRPRPSGRGAVRGRANLQGRPAAKISSPPPAGCAARWPRPPASAAIGRPKPRRSTPSTPRPTPSRCWRPQARRCRPCRSCPAGRPGSIPAAAAPSRLARRTSWAHFGELHPRALEALKAEGPLVAFEVILEKIPEPKAKATRAKPVLELSPFQPVERDFAFVVEASREGRRHRARGAERRQEADRRRHCVRRLRRQGHRSRQEVDRHRRDHAAARQNHDRRRDRRARPEDRRRSQQKDRRRVAGLGLDPSP